VTEGPVRVVSCHVERLLSDDAWRRFDELLRRRPGGFVPIALLRPADRAHGEDETLWLERAHAVAARAPVGLHTHWTSPAHARPTGGDPAQRVRADAEWMREREIEPRFYCGGGWYSDEQVEHAVSELGLVDCTPRGGAPRPGVLPTTHSLGALARAVLRPLPPYLHAYLHDYDLLDPRRRAAFYASLRLLRLRGAAPADLSPASGR
jgi:hypothetical protein